MRLRNGIYLSVIVTRIFVSGVHIPEVFTRDFLELWCYYQINLTLGSMFWRNRDKVQTKNEVGQSSEESQICADCSV